MPRKKMAKIQWSLFGIALVWFFTSWILQERLMNLCICFQKKIPPQKTTRYTYIEAHALTNNELKTHANTLSKFNKYLKREDIKNLQQLLISCLMRISLEDYQNKLKDFADKWQVKHTSFDMGPPIPFHTLVKLVHPENITNEKTRNRDIPR